MDVTKDFGYNFDPRQNVRCRSKTRLPGRNEDVFLPRTKRRKIASRKKVTATPRKNRPYSSIENMNMDCCMEKTCLLNHGRRVIALIRNDFDSKLYEQQNTYLSSLIDVNPNAKRNRITYSIRDTSGLRKVQVCMTAFLKILGIGKKRIAVLLKKIRPYSGDVEVDQRRTNRNAKRIPLGLKAEVTHKREKVIILSIKIFCRNFGSIEITDTAITLHLVVETRA